MSMHFAILIFKSDDEDEITEVFALHPGENTIGSDNGCDIVIQLSDNSIEALHAKVTVNDEFNDIGIEDISISNTIYREKNGTRTKLKKRREYELFPNRIFYLTLKMKFFLYEGQIEQIEKYLRDNNLSYYIGYLKSKANDYHIKEKNEDEDDDNLSLEYREEKNSSEPKKVVNIEDFNNFDYIPGDEKYKVEEDNVNEENSMVKEMEKEIEVKEAVQEKREEKKEKAEEKEEEEEEEGYTLSERLRKRKKDFLNKKHKVI